MRPSNLYAVRRMLSCWQHLLPRPDWYVFVVPEMQGEMSRLKHHNLALLDEATTEIYDFFEEHLTRGDIALGHGAGMDAEREPIDTIVIHHTSQTPGMRATRLSAIELVRLYAPHFLNPTSAQDQHLRGRPIYSGHVRNGRQVFWPYHWIIRKNGRAERLLNDSEIGWHAGDWDINRRSVAITLDNDYEWSSPSCVEIEGIGQTIVDNYRLVSAARIFGHQEITSKTTCPSRLFLTGPLAGGWKREVLECLPKRKAA